MAKNLKLFFDPDGSPRARGPSSEKLLMEFLETDVQGSDHICHDLMDDITAIEDESAESREFVGNAHCVVMSAEGVTIECNIEDPEDELGTEIDKPDPKADKPDTEINKPGTEINKPDTEKVKLTMVSATQYQTGLKHFREVLEDWEAFILDDQSPT